MAKISIFGTGYVGLVTGATLASIGHNVECIDISKDKIDQLNSGLLPFHEPNLLELITRASEKGLLKFSLFDEVKVLDHEFHFLAVGTPENADGSADLTYINSAVGFINRNALSGSIIVTKSTVPIGTNRSIADQVEQNGIHVVSNPEFLREGEAVNDSLNPDRIILGSSSKDVVSRVRLIYEFFKDKCSILAMSWEDAELTKYASNAFLATKISFMNEIAQICDAVKADVRKVKQAMVLDPRINDSFMESGCGYGGSCFPKDVLALEYTARQYNLPLNMLKAVDDTNDFQKTYIIERFLNKQSVKDSKVAVLGLAFKPNTDDVREAPSQKIVEYLVAQQANVTVFDPAAGNNFQAAMLQNNVTNFKIVNSASKALESAEIVVLCTEWEEFLGMERQLCQINELRHVLDGRNIWNKDLFDSYGINYYGVGR